MTHLLQPMHNALPVFVKSSEAYQFSDQDILHICAGKCRIILYKEFEDLFNSDKGLETVFLPEYNYTAALLYTFQDSRHWISMVYHPEEKILYYFGSYGLPVDFELDITCSEPDTYLTKLLQRFQDQFGVHTVVNTVRMQQMRNAVNTCGRYTALRCLMFSYNNTEFNQFISAKIKVENADELVSLLTFASVYWEDEDADEDKDD